MHPGAVAQVHLYCQEQPENYGQQAGKEEKRRRAVEHHESKVPPAIGKGVELGGAFAGMVDYGHFADP